MKLPELIQGVRLKDDAIQAKVKELACANTHVTNLMADLLTCANADGREAVVKSLVAACFVQQDKSNAVARAADELHALLAGYTRTLACETRRPEDPQQMELPFDDEHDEEAI